MYLSKINVGYYISKFPYRENLDINNYVCGGSVLSSYYIILEDYKQGHEIKVFTTSKDKQDSIENYNNLDVHRYGSRPFFTNNISFGVFYKPYTFNLDVINVCFDIPPTPFAGYLHAKRKNIPLVVMYHGDWDASYGSLIRKFGVSFCNKLVNILLSYASVIVSPTNKFISDSQFLSRFKEKTIVVYNGFDPDEFNITCSRIESRRRVGLPSNKRILLFLGYLYPHKCPELLLEILPDIIKFYPDVLLVFGGIGIMEDDLKQQVRDLGLQKHVVFAGFIEKEDRPFYYKASDIFILPSKKESFGNVAFEALLSGTPVIVTDRCGCSEIISEHDCGYVVKYGDLSDLKEKIILLFNNPNMRNRFVHNGREYITKNLTWEKANIELNNIYGRLIKNKTK